VPERDRSWSTWLVGASDSDEETTVRRLLEWAWPTDLRHRPAVPDDVARLAIKMFGWLLTTSDRRVRDRATKSTVSVAHLVDGADLGAAVAGLASSTVVRHVAGLVSAARAAAACRAERALDDRQFGSRRNVAESATDA
jgi:hypothetical protein